LAKKNYVKNSCIFQTRGCICTENRMFLFCRRRNSRSGLPMWVQNLKRLTASNSVWS